MKLRNKKTGEIVDVDFVYPETAEFFYPNFKLVDFNELFEDYEEPKEYWYVDEDGEVWHHKVGKCEDRAARKSIGNYFNTREEADKAVEKLKSWKRLKDKGLKVTEWSHGLYLDKTIVGRFRYEFPIDNKDDIEKDLDLLFGGEE